MGCVATKQAPSQEETKKTDNVPVDKTDPSKLVSETIKQDNAGPRAEPMKTTSRGFQKSKGGSTLFAENSGF
jgi:hypothetical protein